MIQVNATTHTAIQQNDGTIINGLTISTGSVIDVTVLPTSRRIYDEEGVYVKTQHDVIFEANIYKSMASYEGDDSVLVHDSVVEYNIGYVAFDVDIQTILSPTDWLNIYKDHIENGDANYPGVGAGNAAIVWPS